MADEKKPPCSSGDELLPGPKIGDDGHMFVRHTAEHKVVMGVMTPVREGLPEAEGAFRLERIEGTNRYKVNEVQVPGSKGPAKVTSRKYRENYDTIFGTKMAVGEA